MKAIAWAAKAATAGAAYGRRLAFQVESRFPRAVKA